MNELFGKKHTPSLRHGNGRRSKMLQEQSPELPLSYAKTFCQFRNVCVVTIQRSVGNES